MKEHEEECCRLKTAFYAVIFVGISSNDKLRVSRRKIHACFRKYSSHFTHVVLVVGVVRSNWPCGAGGRNAC